MKTRLDILLVRKKMLPSRRMAADVIRAGHVKVNGSVIHKQSSEFEEDVEVEITSLPKYVGRGGFKLEGALDAFTLDVAGFTVVDVGASTGGFTDCLLQRGVKHVYAVDVGTNQLAPQLLKHPQVTSLEKTDIRNLTSLPEKADLAVIDVSFISLLQILPAVQQLLQTDGKIIALIKPQFEVGKVKLKKGIVKNEADRLEVVITIQQWAEQHHLRVNGVIESPIKGVEGNIEYLMYLSKTE